MARIEVSIGYTTQENLLSVVLADTNASLNERGNFEVEVTEKVGTVEGTKAMFEELCPYGKVEVKD